MKYIAATVVAMVLFLGINKAEAGVIFYNTGEDIVEVSDIKEEARAEFEEEYGPGVKIGIIYERFGLFWLDIWRWDARWVIFLDDAYQEMPKEDLEKIAAGSLSKPITMTLPPGLIVLLLGGIGFGIFAFVTRNDEDDENIYEDGIAQEHDAHPGQDPQQYAQQPQQPEQQYQPPQAQQPGQAPQYQPPQAQQPGQAPPQYQQPQQPGQPQPGQAPQQYQHPGQAQAQPQQPGQAPQPAQYPPQPGQPGYDPNNQG